MPYVTIEVKQSHINRGYDNVDDSDACVIALASKPVFKGKEVKCLFDYLMVNGVQVNLPASAKRIQSRIFDGTEKKKLKPFSFRVRVAA